MKMVKRSIDDPMNKNKDDLVVYFNFLLADSGTIYTRTCFNLIDLCREQGGIMKTLSIIAIVVLIPFRFKRHELNVFFDYDYQYS